MFLVVVLADVWQILKMLEAFKEGHTLHIKYAWPLIKEAKEIFAKEETLQVAFRWPLWATLLLI